jgi:hypothetical protein
MAQIGQIKIADGIPSIIPAKGPFTLNDFKGNQRMYDAYLKVSQMANTLDKQNASVYEHKK